MGTLDRGLTHSLTVHDSSRVAPRPRARERGAIVRLDTLTSCSNTYVYNDKKVLPPRGTTRTTRSVGRGSVGRARSVGRAEGGGHRPVVTQRLEHEGRARRARDVGRGNVNGTCEIKIT